MFYSSSTLTKIASPTNSHDARNWKQVLSNSLTATMFMILYYYNVSDIIGSNTKLDSYKFTLPFLSSPIMSTFYLGGFISFYSSSCGDTWASELGSLSRSSPILVTNWKYKVPRGTNGGVTLFGLIASLCGGLFMGITFWLCTNNNQDISNIIKDSTTSNISTTSQIWILFICVFSSMFGSLLDSYLGAKYQYSGIDSKSGKVVNEKLHAAVTQIPNTGIDLLSNNEVNFIANTVTAFVGGLLSVLIFCYC